MSAFFECLNCGNVFEHSWTGGDPRKPGVCAAVDCPSCFHIYVEKQIEDDSEQC